MKIPGAGAPHGHTAHPVGKAKAKAQTAPFVLESLLGALAAEVSEQPANDGPVPAGTVEARTALPQRIARAPQRQWAARGAALSLPRPKTPEIHDQQST